MQNVIITNDLISSKLKKYVFYSNHSKGNCVPVQNTVAQKLLIYMSIDTKITNWSRTAQNNVLTVLDQVIVLAF